MGFVANFFRFPAVQKFWKSVKIWQSYREFKDVNVLKTQCIYDMNLEYHAIATLDTGICYIIAVMHEYSKSIA